MRRLSFLIIMFIALTACNQPSPTSPVLTIKSLTATPNASNPLQVTFAWRILTLLKNSAT
jgi:hypothetical protein